MLMPGTLEYSNAISQRLKNANVKIEAAAYSPLSNVINTLYPILTDNQVTKIDEKPIDYLDVIAKTSANNTELSAHSEVSLGLAESLASHVEEHLSFARSVVNPAVTSYMEAIQRRISVFTYNDPTADFTIDKVYIPEPLLNSSLLADIGIHKGKKAYEFKEVLKAGSLTVEEIQAKLFTGLSSVDKDIREWLGTFDVSLLFKVWNVFFNSESYENNPVIFNTYQEHINGYLILYLLSRKMENDVMHVEGKSSMAYDHIVKGLELISACFVLEALRELDYATKVERLIISSNKKNLTVYGPIYDKYMEEGGSIEHLLGQLVSGNGASTIEGIKELADSNLKTWNRYIALNNYNNKKDRAELLRTIYTSEFVNQLSDMDDREKEYHDKHPGHADLAYMNMKDYIACLSEEDLENIGKTSLMVIAGNRFNYTNSLQILTDMEEAMKANPDINPREAATIAVINLVTDYIIPQIRRI